MSATLSGYRFAPMDTAELDPDEVARRSAEAMERADEAGRGAGVRLLDVGPGRSRVALTVQQRHVNGHGICHGGYLFLLADAALAFASNSHGVSAVAAGADIVFLRPVPLGAELQAEAVERVLAGRSGLYDVTVTVDDRPVAEFRGRTRQVPNLPAPP
jgi:acyl-CoA thioesterase